MSTCQYPSRYIAYIVLDRITAMGNPFKRIQLHVVSKFDFGKVVFYGPSFIQQSKPKYPQLPEGLSGIRFLRKISSSLNDPVVPKRSGHNRYGLLQ